MKRRTRFLLITAALIVPFVWAQAVTLAQGAIPADQCAPALTTLWTQATDTCINRPAGYICNGGAAPAVEPQGAISNALAATGSLVAVGEVDALRTPRLSPESGSGGVAYLRLAAPLQYTLLLLGDVTLRDISPAEFPAWTSFAMATDINPPTCAAAPGNAVILQTPLGVSTRIVVNGASLVLSGTLLIRTDLENTTFVSLSGVSSVLALMVDQPLPTGNQVVVAHSPQDYAIPISTPSVAVPFNVDALQYIPLALLDRPVILSQPGNVVTQGDVNLRADPDIYSGIITQVPAGEVMSVLGRNDNGLWYHVRRDSGETGWMLAELLSGNVTDIRAVYAATPMPPQRFGEFATRGRVIAPAGVNIRVGPDGMFPVLGSLDNGAIVSLIARSAYSPWVKVETGGVQGWIALVSLETTTYFEALPIDPRAPVPPGPTTVPGTFGNAFPNPDSPGN